MTVTAAEVRSLYNLKSQKKSLEEEIDKIEKKIKKEFEAEGVQDQAFDDLLVHIKVTPPTRIVDTAKLKKDGLFEAYSKDKAGFSSVMVSEAKVPKSDKVVL